MAIDALVKRFFPGILLVLIALAAYFQGSGLVQLFTTGLFESDDAAVKAWSATAGKSRAVGSGNQLKSIEPILSRNPFDSVTGPLNVQPLDASDAVSKREELDTSDPLNARNCEGVVAQIVTESPDPLWSIAVLQAPGEPEPKLRRVGDAVGDKKVAYIGFNAQKFSPAVWLASESVLCQAVLFPTEAAGAAAAAGPAPMPDEAAGAMPPRRAARGAAPVPADIANKIQKVNDNEFHVDRAVVDNILENQAELMRSARIVPEQKDGKVVGIRLFGIRPDTILGKLGLQNGDRLESINGFNMASPEKALEAYARLRTADSLNVKVTRRGQPMNIDFQIK
jgi:general secretion pathway protein C